MAKERIIKLPETDGTFQARGLVTGVSKDSFFKETLDKSQRPNRKITFGLKTSENNTLYITLKGRVQDFVYFYKKSEKEGEKGHTQDVAWNDRNKFNKEGYNLLGTSIGLKSVTDEKGKIKNDTKTYTDYDACQYLKENLEDGMHLFVNGKIERSSMVNDKGSKIQFVNLIPNRIYKSVATLDFKAEDFKEESLFTQTMIYKNSELVKGKDGKPEKLVIDADIVNYQSIEGAEFVVRDINDKIDPNSGKPIPSFGKNVKTRLKPYTKVTFSGKIFSYPETEEEEVADDWGGESNEMNRKVTTFKKEFLITGVDGKSIDADTYNQKVMDAAKKTILEFSQTDTTDADWGGTTNTTNSNSDWDNI